MRIINLTVVNIKRYLKNPTILFLTFIMPVIFLVGMDLKDGGKTHSEIGIIDNDNSQYSEILIENIEESYEVIRYSGSVEENYSKIIDGDVNIICVINKDFQADIKAKKSPVVQCHKKEQSEGSMTFENALDEMIKNLIKEEIQPGLSSKYIETIIDTSKVSEKNGYTYIVMMICYFMFIGSSMTSQDIMQLKTQKVLKRNISTPNSDISILSGMFLGAFVVQGILSFLAYMIVSMFLKVPFENLPLAIWVIALCSLISTAIIICAIRWIKNNVLAMLTIMIFGILTFGIAMVNANLEIFEGVPKAIEIMSIISPFHWMNEILKTGRVIVPTIVLTTMSLVFLTIGSFRLRDFVKE